jgi:hypothetical protein
MQLCRLSDYELGGSLMGTNVGRSFSADELLRQLGGMNVLAISGGRVTVVNDSDGETVQVLLPVGNGYRVSIQLGWDDTYTVSRQFVRSGKVSDKGTIDGVYCEIVGEVAYQASCFRNVEFGSLVTS